jgi:hypothetical protein
VKHYRDIVCLPPSGQWSGYYQYGYTGQKHRMKLGLTFGPDGTIRGEGIDDVAHFTINGSFDAAKNEASWIKAYLGMHNVEYRGVYDQRSICGSWTLILDSGGFWIWPDALSQSESKTVEVELEQPALV